MLRAVLVASLIACAPAPRAPQPPRTDAPLVCELYDYTITSIAPYTEPVPGSKIGATRTRGAELVVDARAGLSREWLQLELARHIEAAHHAMPTPDCPLDVDGITVAVQSRDTGYAVQLRAERDDDAAELLRRAHALVDMRVAR